MPRRGHVAAQDVVGSRFRACRLVLLLALLGPVLGDLAADDGARVFAGGLDVRPDDPPTEAGGAVFGRPLQIPAAARNTSHAAAGQVAVDVGASGLAFASSVAIPAAGQGALPSRADEQAPLTAARSAGRVIRRHPRDEAPDLAEVSDSTEAPKRLSPASMVLSSSGAVGDARTADPLPVQRKAEAFGFGGNLEGNASGAVVAPRAAVGSSGAGQPSSKDSSSKAVSNSSSGNVSSSSRAEVSNASTNASDAAVLQASRLRSLALAAAKASAACMDVSEALPFLSQEVSRIALRDGKSCLVPVLSEHCVTTHPLWNCAFQSKANGTASAQSATTATTVPGRPGATPAAVAEDAVAAADGTCACQWLPTCHGVGALLQSQSQGDVPLVCGPDEASSACRCRGFQECPAAETHGWRCLQDKADTTWGLLRVQAWIKAKGVKDGSSAANASAAQGPLEQKLMNGGTCTCLPSVPRLQVPMTDSERKEYLAEPLAIAQIARQEAKEAARTAAGKSISTREVHEDKNGEKQVVLTVVHAQPSTTNAPVAAGASQLSSSEQGKAVNLAPVGSGSMDAAAAVVKAPQAEQQPEQIERCVITGGALNFSVTHWIVLGVVLVPLAVAILVTAQLRWHVLNDTRWCDSLVRSPMPLHGFGVSNLLQRVQRASPAPAPASTPAGPAAQQPFRGIGQEAAEGTQRSPLAADASTALGDTARPLNADSVATGAALALAGAGSMPPKRPPASLVVLLVLLVILLKLNVSQILTTSHLIVNDLTKVPVNATSVAAASAAAAASEAARKKAQGAIGHGSSLTQEKDSYFDPNKDQGLGGATSGVLIAAEPFGGILGVVVVARYLLHKPRETLLGSVALVFVSSLGCILGLQWQSLKLVLLSRVVGGLAEGALFLGQTYLARLSSPDRRTEVFGYWELGTAMGLLGGICGRQSEVSRRPHPGRRRQGCTSSESSAVRASK
eukprot:TRINITY_DN41539_c0_g2_i3.p1 TRINITY_DN41539_c0_g2~~TRINITY_DN41539_c0_g2_i3.p1  ORF type:complete len:963 (-),score=206.11 TRINITY_DN41539_c0_g2_i3:36-2924(-)